VPCFEAETRGTCEASEIKLNRWAAIHKGISVNATEIQTNTVKRS